MNKKFLLATVLTLCLVLGLNSLFGYSESITAEATTTSLNIPAKVTATTLNVRKTASLTGAQLTVNKAKVALKKGTALTVVKQKVVSGKKWYYVSFKYNGATQKGYVLSDYACITFSNNVSAVIKASSSVKVRKAAGTDKPYLKIGSKTVALKNKQQITITKETTDARKTKWFKVSFISGDETLIGYVPADNTTLTGIAYKVGEVTATSLFVRKEAGMTGEKLLYNNTAVLLKKGMLVTIKASKVVDNVTWYKVDFTYENKVLSGYVSGQYVTLTNKTGTAEPSPSTGGTATPKPGKSEEPTTTPKPGKSEEPTTTPKPSETPGDASPTPVPNSEFQSYLAEQGFPESYRDSLTKLHNEHPNWIFKAYQTGLDWNTVIDKETKVGLNLLSKNKTSGWKSYEAGAYDWSTDSFIVFDGSTWVTASKEAVEYYMDPRNFLFQNTIFQFEALEYQPDYQIKSGVENILKNTPMAETTFTYIEDTGEEKSMLYSQAFIEAAAASGVSPYHLSSRVKQEIVKNSTTFSDSVTGAVTGYEGYYNFYNIGATHSTAAGGAIANGLNFAMGGTISAEATRQKYNLPWDNRYKSIVGGARYIGTNYINRGQNTIYLQKFNVTPTSTYTHQYMANVEAANSEAAKTYTAYSGMGLLDTVLVFNIPVYANMPASPCPVPTIVKNPNNWLKSLSIAGYSLTPAFKTANGGYKDYKLEVNDSTVTSVSLTAKTINISATMKIKLTQGGNTTTVDSSGNTMIPLAVGENVVTISVTAENGKVNTYVVTITKTQ